MPKQSACQVGVSFDVWRKLNAQKTPGDTFDDVLRRLLDLPPWDPD